MIGHIKIDRKILNWEWYSDIKVFHYFLYLLLKANHKDGKWKGMEIKRGQLVTGRLKSSKDTGLTEREIRTCRDKLKTTNEITVKTTNKYSIITICKYDFYQSNNYTNDQQNDQQVSQRETNKRPTNDQQTTTNNNDNKDKEGKEGRKKLIFNTRPTSSDFNGLPEQYIEKSIELVKFTKQVDVTKEIINGMWEIFKVQKLTGDEYHANEGKVYSYFLDWVKYQKFNKNNQKPGTGIIV